MPRAPRRRFDVKSAFRFRVWMVDVMSTEEIQVLSITGPSRWAADGGYSVRWRYGGRDRVRSFDNKAEAALLKSKIQAHAAGGSQFDPSTGLPRSVGVGLGDVIDIVA